VQHPGLYYGFAAGLSYLIPGFSHQHFDVQVFWLRMISLLLLARVATGDLSRSMAAWTGLAWAGGLLTKGLALAMPPVIVAAYLVGASGSLRERIRRAWRPALLAGAVGAAVGGWWWVRNLVVYGTVQPDGLGPVYSKTQFGPDRPGGTDLKFLENFVRLFGKRVWGSLGLLDIPAMPTVIPVLIEAVFLALVAVGIAVGLRRSPAPRWAGAVFVLPVVLTLGVLYLGTRHWYLHTTKLPGLQARYLFPLLAGITVLAALGLRRLAGRLSRWLPAAVAFFAVLFQLGAAAVVLDVEMSPPEPGRFRRIVDGLHWVLGWAPWRQPLTEGFLVAGSVVAVGTLAVLVAGGIRHAVPALASEQATPALEPVVDQVPG
jgi:small subunit ribosomal protein S36